MSGEKCEHFVIYEKPIDAPCHFVVRRFEISPFSAMNGKIKKGKIVPKECEFFPNLKKCRESIPKGLTRFARDSDDPKSVVETWI
jgi:hypothetical protein